ncbi:Dihydroxyacetone kinase [Teratosphaeria destructans]|uniref:Dihydroxyacetone kinase n=1 Tax=Teratosphaeria destructans TaxID=418781 RepID=A0A9W7VYM6_9PEZI|nr:Dihydroxyacetone kinase [Teratosphaeria destructans]
MAIVVEQTIPFAASSLDLDNASRWNTLFPLVRPSVQPVRTPKGQTILVDTAHARKKFVHIAAIGTEGNFSSKLLDERNVTAIVTERKGAGLLTAQDIQHALQSADISIDHGLIVLRASDRRELHQHSIELLEVELMGELELDHLICLLGRTSESVLMNVHNVQTLLRLFVKKGASTAHSSFHVERAEGNPAVLHVDGVQGFEKARQAVQRDLKRVVGSQTGGEGRQNVVVARPGKSQNLNYNLTHSTILNHTSAARGFSISIVPLAAHFLTAQATPKPHHPPTPQADTTLQTLLSPSNAAIPFDDAQVRTRIEAGCAALIQAEPTITDYDTIVGDGDCGYTLRDGAKQVLAFIQDRDLSRLPETVAALVGKLEMEMGGTSGALYCIFLTALATSLAAEASVPAALGAALRELCKYTRARVGDRTMMDALIPFVETWEGTGDVGRAVEEARKGVEGTKGMQARLGRSTYLDEGRTRGVPDPGAHGLLVLLEGMCGRWCEDCEGASLV